MPTISHSPVTSKALSDTAATAHYLHPSALPHFSHVAHTKSGPTVQVANRNIINPAFSATLQLSNKLSSRAHSDHVFNDIKTGSLISMGQLCNDDYVAIFAKFDVKILKPNQVIITGLRYQTNDMVPHLAHAVTWSHGRARGAGAPTDRRTLLLALY